MHHVHDHLFVKDESDKPAVDDFENDLAKDTIGSNTDGAVIEGRGPSWIVDPVSTRSWSTFLLLRVEWP